MHCSMPGFPVLHCLPTLAQTHVHWINDAIQPAHPLSPSSPPSLKYSHSVQFSHLVVFKSLRPHGLQHARPPCPSSTPGACSNSCPLHPWCHPAISSSVVPFSSCLQSFPESGSFQMSQFFTSGGQSTGVSTSASVLPMNIQDWFPLGLAGWIILIGLAFMYQDNIWCVLDILWY